MPNALRDPIQRAHAKLTVYLHITGTRPDGYHLIDAEMVSLDLYDELRFEAGDSLQVTGLGAQFIPSTADNLVAKALKVAGTTAAVTLYKSIPTGGGLGGGSSDAAAALRWAGGTDPLQAARIGADLPFCIQGGRARVTGIGEELAALAYEPRTFTLVIPPFGVNTAAVYKAFDAVGSGSSDQERTNHLLKAATEVEPRLKRWNEKIREWTGVKPTLAGSGATWFVEGAFPAPPEDELEGGRWVVTSTTPPLSL